MHIRYVIYLGMFVIVVIPSGVIFGFYDIWPGVILFIAAILAIEIGAYVRRRKYRNND